MSPARTVAERKTVQYIWWSRVAKRNQALRFDSAKHSRSLQDQYTLWTFCFSFDKLSFAKRLTRSCEGAWAPSHPAQQFLAPGGALVTCFRPAQRHERKAVFVLKNTRQCCDTGVCFLPLCARQDPFPTGTVSVSGILVRACASKIPRIGFES